jgi:hypothetical protein
MIVAEGQRERIARARSRLSLGFRVNSVFVVASLSPTESIWPWYTGVTMPFVR